MAKKIAKKKTPSKAVKKTETTAVKPASAQLKETLNTQNKSILTGVLVLILIIAGAYLLYKTQFVAAYVNGQPISRLKVINELEKQNGKTVLNQLVTEKLIQQEAEKKHITVSQADINKELKSVESSLSQQGMTIDQALQSQGMSRAQLNDQVKLQLLVQKMVPTPTVSDKEIDDYITKNQEQITPEQQAQPNFRTSIKTQLLQQKQQSAIQKFISDLQNKAKIQTVVKY